MQPVVARKLKTTALICGFTCLAGAFYQFVEARHVDLQSVVVGLPLGINFALFELFLFQKTQKKLYRMQFTLAIIFKAILYTSTVFIIAALLGLIDGYIQGKNIKEFIDHMFSLQMAFLISFTLCVYIIINFFIQLSRLLGPGVLLKFLIGKYYNPSEEDRIFMFLDIKSSTQIAERLGHKKFYSLLNDFFHEISDSVMATRAEIYRYVGDEVILMWEVDNGLENANCLNIFFMIKNSLLEHCDDYMRKYDVVPAFKAGLHHGTVISAEIGDLKKEITYSGDVLNTTSRIQEQCNIFECELLVSGSLMEQLDLTNRYQAKKIDTVRLRGKERNVDIYHVDLAQ